MTPADRPNFATETKDSIRLFEAMRLFAIVSGYNAANDQRKAVGASMAYDTDAYQNAIEETERRLQAWGIPV